MSNKHSYNGNNGIGFGGALLLVFITLKLLGVINWSWWWVLAPAWISILVGIFIVFIMVAIVMYRESE